MARKSMDGAGLLAVVAILISAGLSALGGTLVTKELRTLTETSLGRADDQIMAGLSKDQTLIRAFGGAVSVENLPKEGFWNFEQIAQIARALNAYARDRDLDTRCRLAGVQAGECTEQSVRDPVRLPTWIPAVGWEQYVCYMLAAACMTVLLVLRRQATGELKLYAATHDNVTLPNLEEEGDIRFTQSDAQSARSGFNGAAIECAFGKNLPEARKKDLAAKLTRRSAWVAMINSLLVAFGDTNDPHRSVEIAVATMNARRQQSEGLLHIEQYLQLAIPGVGFFGTIRGISYAMESAQSSTDLPLVVSYMAIAFYSTLVALTLNLLLLMLRAFTLKHVDNAYGNLEAAVRGKLSGRLKTVP